MDNKINEIRRKISFLRSEMLNFEDKIRRHISRDEDCSAASLRLMMEMRVQITALIRDRNALGGHERMLNVDERLKADYRAVNPKPIKGGFGPSWMIPYR
jgi:hypothetical protein